MGSVTVAWSNDGFVAGAEPLLGLRLLSPYKYAFLPTLNAREILTYWPRCASAKW